MQAIEILRKFIIEEIAVDSKPGELHENLSLLESGILDSLSIMKLVAFIEEKFQLQIPDEDLIPENFETLSALVKFISSKR